MSLWFLVFLSVLQGVTELFPVSSLGHTLLVPALFGMHIDKHAPQLLPFLVALHLGTALALLWYFRARWVALIGGFFAQLGGRKNDDGHLMWALIIGTIPTGIVGLLLEKRIERVFHDLRIVAIALIVNGVLLWLGDRIQRSRAHQAPEKMTFKQAFFVGLAQIGALIPGFSRSGLTMIAGNAAGLTAEKAAEFSFLLGTPIIFAAGVLELPKLFHARDQLADALLGGVLTAIAAYLSVRFLMRYFEGRGRLASFGVYCVIAGVFCLGWFMLHPQPV
ncbi:MULTISPECIES: undecaprenyl-diphosphate phosphatase [Burkholderia]|uniref:Undecaprenyl-diphosphatase 2 n=2 Tax=Burkholderia lata (strain ATCC 17760 / DSM 23089 / LMG 22485 / NCIMB 9086 / R18194 / 383) TaxID=482957 RepID=UPPP2_BURL3|nr:MULTISPECIES: undecaprenyl-diphosphate phosphatase [Burkholderia]Q39HK8.1 RecName: Full=Undecaprenyl-diphosphatase 2; AltName: Full=Bacitracin resistance protein 2; AltName: Full=Undecaprenyl pyrophosphate phosphatase 2 [Burkholderia lata]MBN3794528.1 undecaprenyl-diphosphate phosphatase [Burkholderia sp. Ac-20392]MBN3823479.1 undecaprenyl-diphosphate phosphatase [Burkholderia sp. Ac-20384]MBZ5794711.1 undecaprenyl-diphosphate phosphatase [Burkholderia contaminans]NTY37825.1 undecaprenyl-di